MIGTGTIINVAGVLIGGLLGLILGNRIEERFQQTLTSAAGISVLFLGIGGAMEKMLKISENSLISQGTMMIIISIALGALIGEILNIEGRFEDFGTWLKYKTKSQNDTSFVDGFVSTSHTICIGAMAVVGSLNDGIMGDYSVLTAKAILDLIIVLIMTASQGKGCIFSAIPVFVLQGTITLLSRFIEPVMTEAALTNLSLVGSILIFCVGINLVWGKKVKVANFLPALIIAVIWTYF